MVFKAAMKIPLCKRFSSFSVVEARKYLEKCYKLLFFGVEVRSLPKVAIVAMFKFSSFL